MSQHEFDLESLIAPLGVEAFLQQYWERQPLLLQRRDPEFFRSLLTIQDIEQYIARADARYPAIRLAKGGAFFAPEAYTRDVRYGDEIFHGLPDVERIFTEYSNGATVTLPALHLSWSPLARLCASLEASFDHSVHTNAYLTPARTPGFTPHYDTHEVFVLQIAGAKRWRVYPPPLMLPHRSQPFSPDQYRLPAQPLMQFELSAGDLLYLPRGHVHTTDTGDSYSAHITIGITVYTWIELLSEWVHSSVERPEWRQALPPGFGHRPELQTDLQNRFAELFGQFSASMDPATLIQRLSRRSRATRTTPMGFHADGSIVGADTLLRLAPGQDASFVRDSDSILLQIGGRRVRLQAATAPTLEVVARGAAFTPQSLPVEISLDARLALLRYLHGLGLVRVVQDGTQSAG